MLKQRPFLLPAGLLAIALLLLAGYLWRPITIYEDNHEISRFRSPVWTVGQALAKAGASLDPSDQVTPRLDQPIPFDGGVHIRRARQIYLWDNGVIRKLAGLESTPGKLLSRAGVRVNPGDRLLHNGLPLDPAQPIAPNASVVLQLVRAHPVTLSVRGKEQAVRVGGPSAAHALWEAGMRIAPGDLVFPAPGALLEEQAMVAYQPAQPVSIQVGESTVRARTAAETVGQALAEARVTLQGLDYSQPAEDQPLPRDGQIRVVRVREEIALQEELLPYGSDAQPDPELELDQQRTLQAGQYGVQVSRERVRYEDGQEVNRNIDSDWTASKPVDQLIGYGTKAVPKVQDTPHGQIEYYRAVRVYATSYSPCRLGTGDGRCGYTTASGMPMGKGIIGTSKSWFQMFSGHQVYVEGYGFGVIADYGAISGNRIDLGFDDASFEQEAFVGWVTMYFLTPIPANVPWALP